MMGMIIRGFISFIGILLLWNLIVILFALPPYILPTPYQVILAFYNNFSLIFNNAIPTLTETILGLIFGITLGSIAALSLVFFKNLRHWLLPLLITSQAIPTFAIAPIIVIWLGYGMASKVATTTILIFFPITSALYDGLRNTNKNYLALAKTMSATKWRTFLFIRIPAAMPSFASGLRLAAVIAPIGAVIGEWVGASKGLGFLMINANARMEIDLMFAALIAIVLISLVLYFSIDKTLKYCIKW